MKIQRNYRAKDWKTLTNGPDVATQLEGLVFENHSNPQE
jgi:hypothetical protein